MLLLQGAASHGSVNVRMVFRSAIGTLLHTVASHVPFEGGAVFNLSGYPAARGPERPRDHRARRRVRGLTVKAVAVEPATGFTFDTPGVPLPH